LTINLAGRVSATLESIWAETEARPDFLNLMRQALSLERAQGGDVDQGPNRWAQLPGLCCQAAGGDPLRADDFAAAWLLLYLAADLMDSVQDGDAPDPWWAEQGPGMALSVATGLFFSASLALNRFRALDSQEQASAEVVKDFYQSFLYMSSGQYLDLLQAQPSLEEYWQIAAAKSGVFFSLACRTGARLAIAERARVDSFSHFGKHLGLLIQIRDDLEDLMADPKDQADQRLLATSRSLPVAYALQVSSPDVRSRLLDCLQRSLKDDRAAREAWDLVEESGAALYVVAELERHRTQAFQALEQAQASPPARERLVGLVNKMGSLPSRE
jgi:geranylgeranyl pyrophosphate synthase